MRTPQFVVNKGNQQQYATDFNGTQIDIAALMRRLDAVERENKQLAARVADLEKKTAK